MGSLITVDGLSKDFYGFLRILTCLLRIFLMVWEFFLGFIADFWDFLRVFFGFFYSDNHYHVNSVNC
jgi:hypothetical protein